MRVLVATPTFFPIVGGAELLIRDVLNAWAEEHDVRLLTPCLPEFSRPFWIDADGLSQGFRFEVKRFEDRLNLLDMRGHRLTRGLIPPMSLSAVRVLMQEARATRPDVLVGFFGVPYGLPLSIVSAALGIPYALVFCGTDLPSPRTAHVPLWRHYLRLAADRATRAVYVSRFCYDALNLREFDPRHDGVILGGVQLPTPATPPPDSEALRASLGIAPDDIMLFALQRLGTEKRVDVLIRALASLPPVPRRVKLVIGGQGSEASYLKGLSVQMGVRDDVVFTGHLGAEKDAYYRACDIFVFHSLFETFGQVLAEAMSAGKPIVSVRAGAIPEVVEDGVTGLLARPLDPVGIASLIAELAADEGRRREMGRRGRERARELFDWESSKRQWIELLEMVDTNVRPAHAEKAFRAQAGGQDG